MTGMMEPQRYEVHIEARLRTLISSRPDLVGAQLNDWITRNYEFLTTGSEIIALSEELHEALEKVTVAECAVAFSTGLTVPLAQAKLVIHCYRLREVDEPPDGNDNIYEDHDIDGVIHGENTKITSMPNVNTEGLWENLLYEPGIKSRLIRFSSSILLFSKQGINTNIITVNRLILLHGLPGTGKTTLCRGLAQKLAIRFSQAFSSTKLIEIHGHSLFSKWFSESAAAVARLFQSINQTAMHDRESFIILLIDEVETLTSSRMSSVTGKEPMDALRATNALLQGLDLVKARENVLILCTSNMIEAMDPAFLDRADLLQHVPKPSIESIYNILRDCLSEMMQKRIITGAEGEAWAENIGHIDMSPTQSADLAATAGLIELSNKWSLPTYVEAQLGRITEPGGIGAQLLQVSQLSNDAQLSGRALRRLPVVAHGTEIGGRHCSLSTMLEALKKCITLD